MMKTIAESRKACGALGKVADEIDEIIQLEMSKKVGRRSRKLEKNRWRSRPVSQKIGEANPRSIDTHNQIKQIAAL
jgi:hypothetical protein